MLLLITILKLHSATNLITGKEEITSDSGDIDDRVSYAFENGILTISGTDVLGIPIVDHQPWISYKSQIKEVIIEEGITTVYEKTFYNLDQLTSITFPESATSIEFLALGNCSKLSTIIIAEGNQKYTVIDNVVYSKNKDKVSFVPMTKSTDYSFPNTVTTIDRYALSFCQKEEIIIPSQIKTIMAYAFINSNGAKSLVIPDTVTTIYDNAFENFQSLEEVTIGNGITKIAIELFLNCPKLKTVTFKENCKATSIWDHCFAYCISLTSINIPNSVTTIYESAFRSCDSLKTIEIPGSVSEMRDDVFYKCSSLTSVTLNDGIIKLGHQMFFECHNLKSIIMPDTLSEFGSWSFYETGIEILRLSKNLSVIPPYSFQYCYELKSVIIPDNVTTIGSSAFRYCSNIRYIYLGKSVTSIDSSGFLLSQLSTVFYSGINEPEITDDSFGNDVEIEVQEEYASDSFGSYTISKTLKYESLTDDIIWTFNIRKGNLVLLGIGEIPDYSSPSETPWNIYSDFIKSIYVDEGITSIGKNAFSSCTNLNSLKIGNKVKRIGSFAFNNCGNVEAKFVIPNSIIEIEDSAFANTYFNNLVFNGEKEPKCSNAFGSNPPESLYVKVLDNYKGTSFCGLKINDGDSVPDASPTPTLIPTPTPIPELILEIEITENTNANELDTKLKEKFGKYADSKDTNLIALINSENLEFNSKLEDNQFIKPTSDTTIDFKGGNLNLVLPAAGSSTTIILNEEEKTNLLLKGNGDVTLKHQSQGDKKSIHISNSLLIDGDVNINIPDYIDSFEVDSINFDTSSTINVKKENTNQKKANLIVHNISANYYSNGLLTDFTILDSVTIYQTALLSFDNVDCENAKIELIISTYNSNVKSNPFLAGNFKNPPNSIDISKNKNNDDNGPSLNDEYQLAYGLFDQNKCTEWLNKINYGNSGFNAKECIDINDLLSNQENKKIVIKNVAQPKDNNKLSKTQIIGIAVGCVLGVALIVGIIVGVVICKKKKKDDDSNIEDEP